MDDNITLKPQQTNPGVGMLMHEELERTTQPQQPTMAARPAYAQAQAGGQACPVCGTVNEAEAFFCASCGTALRKGNCPNCGSEIDPDADFCEACHQYIRKEVCSFCGARLVSSEPFCPECGSPRNGIVCPTCKTLNSFSFCKQCGSPLTKEAHKMLEQLRQQPEYQEMTQLAKELQDLDMLLPIASPADQEQEMANNALRERVLKLLAEDAGVPDPVVEPKPSRRMDQKKLNATKEEKMQKLAELLDKMVVKPTPSPAKARNYAMACKPAGVRLAWVCNYKHAMHSSPCGCAKPQMGGKWVFLGKGSKAEIKDDK